MRFVSQNTMPTAIQINAPTQSVRDYLVQDVLDDSDSDSEFEAALNREDAKDTESKTQGTGKVEEDFDARRSGDVPKAPQRLSEGENDDDEEMQEYEAVTGLRRRNNAVSSESGKGNLDEKGAGQSSASEEAAPTALQSERSIQDSLSGELLRMAGILKTNSIKFADALERDRKVLEEADEKLQGNLTLMTRTRGRLGEYSRKARGMGWVTLGSVVAVCISWMLMFVVIRLT